MADFPQLAGLVDARRRMTAHEMVRDVLRRAILSGVLAGGTRLVQANIAESLDVSTTPVREALRDLASEGLIRIDPHRGAVVHETSLEELQELYEIRKALEPLAMRRAAERITDTELDDAARLQERMDAESDPAEWVKLNWEFHALLERAASSPRLSSMVKTVQDASAQYVGVAVVNVPGRAKEGNAEHHAILAAMRARDGRRAAKLLVEHLDNTLKVILDSRSI